MGGRPPRREEGRTPGRAAVSYDPRARRDEAPATLPLAPACPFCEGADTELMSAFGSHASVSTYWCRRCRSPFEMLKWRG